MYETIFKCTLISNRRKVSLVKFHPINNLIKNIVELNGCVDYEINLTQQLNFLGKGRKHSGKIRKCWSLAFSPFPTMFSKVLFFEVIYSCDCMGQNKISIVHPLTNKFLQLVPFCSWFCFLGTIPVVPPLLCGPMNSPKSRRLPPEIKINQKVLIDLAAKSKKINPLQNDASLKLTLSQTISDFKTLKKKSFENIVGNGKT